MSDFYLNSNFSPKGDQPNAIKDLSKAIELGKKHHVLLGVTGSGKTFTMANVIKKVKKPSLIIAPNKTLAAQLYSEFAGLFPDNAVAYFVSYYDYYQPEAYIPASDTYIQKDSSINDMIDKLRHFATCSVLSRRDAIVVASVSCIFGLGAPEDYLAMRIVIRKDEVLLRDDLLKDLVKIQYERNDYEFTRGTFRVRGDRVEIFPAYEEKRAIRIDFFGDDIDAISEIDPLKGNVLKSLNEVTIFPASHYVTNKRTLETAISSIKEELKGRVDFFRNENKLIEAQRIEEKTNYDIEMMTELGYCNGIENYSRHITGRKKGAPPPTLLDYFPDDFLVFVDESHITIPQLHAMYKGDRSRKETLIKYGFRLPSAIDNRPFKFEEFMSKLNQIVYVSATPSEFELEKSNNAIIEQIVRPTGLCDPVIEIRKAKHQIDDLLEEIRLRINKKERVLITTLTKKMAEDLSEYYQEIGINVQYLHSDVKTLERIEIINDLRSGKFDVLIGINLLREGLDIPEVSLVAILDADKEGFLRSEKSLIQTCGRASRNVNGMVIMYADNITKSMKKAIGETDRRRKIQKDYNIKHKITPTTIKKNISSVFDYLYDKDDASSDEINETVKGYETIKDIDAIIASLKVQMEKYALDLEFEKAAEIRDKINVLKKKQVFEI